MSFETKDTSWISDEEQVQIEQLRQTLLGVLPPDLDTDLNLLRWVRGWKGNIAQASPRFRQYVENRRAANLDKPDLIDRYLTYPIFKLAGQNFPSSLTPGAINPIDNTVVVIQRPENTNLHQAARVFKCGDFLSLCFLTCERMLRQVLQREKETGRPSGLTIIHDFSNFPVWHYLNPNAPIHKMNNLCLGLMQDSYCNILHRVYIVNAPPLAMILLEITKKFLNSTTQEKLVIVPDKETLFTYVHRSVVPSYFGGDYKLSQERMDEYQRAGLRMDPATCCLIPQAFDEARERFVPKIMPVPTKVEYLKPKQELRVELKSSGRGSAWWQFRVNSDISFGVTWIDEDGTKSLVYPRLVMNTPELPEQGHVTPAASAIGGGTFVLEFKNCSTTWFKLKLEYAAYVDENGENNCDQFANVVSEK